MKFFAAGLLSFFVSLCAVASDVQGLFEALKDKPVDYGPSGQICEQVARLQLADQFDPRQYVITGGVEYSYQKRTIGELDVVIMDKSTHDVVLIGEVKCWNNLDSALNKAHKQRTRFLNYLQSRGSQIEFQSHDGEAFVVSQFAGKGIQFISISQDGGRKHGFDMDLQYSLSDLMSLRKMLQECQDQRKCPRPLKDAQN